MSLLEKGLSRVGGGIETWIAALAAFVTGAAVFLMPGGILQNAVMASGLPDTLPQLVPPLGMKARLGLALLGAGFSFGMVVMLTKLMAWSGRGRPAKVEEVDLPPVPRVRRRDRHPDAPVRAPLSISRDIAASEDEFPTVMKGAPFDEALEAGEPEIEAAPVDEPFGWSEPEVPQEPEELIPPAPAEASEPFEWEEEAPTAVPSARPAWLDSSTPQPPPREESVSALMARLERALERRNRAFAPAEAPSPQAAEPVEAAPDLGDQRLRSALESLKRFAPGAG